LKVTLRTRLFVKLGIVHTCPLAEGQFVLHPPKVPAVEAVSVIGPVLRGKLTLQFVWQMKPEGDMETDPVPAPKKSMVKIADPLLVPVKQTTFAVILPVTIAPDELRPPVLELV